MKKFNLAFVSALALLLATPAFAEGPTPTKQKSKLNTNLYEQDSKDSTVSGKVKAVREVQGDTEVFLDNPKGNSGPYTLPENIKDRANLLKILQASQKPGGGSVTMSIDDQQRIKSVESSGGSAKSSPSIPEF
jgi:hypothetical protein